MFECCAIRQTGSYFAAKICSKCIKLVILNDYIEPLVKLNNIYSTFFENDKQHKNKPPIFKNQTDRHTDSQAGWTEAATVIIYSLRITTLTRPCSSMVARWISKHRVRGSNPSLRVGGVGGILHFFSRTLHFKPVLYV